MFRRKKASGEAKKAKDAREKKKLALFLTPNPPTPPLKKRSGRLPLKQGNAVIPHAMKNEYKDSESSSESSTGSSDTSESEAPVLSPNSDSTPPDQGNSLPTPDLQPPKKQEVVRLPKNPSLASALSKIPKKSSLKTPQSGKTKRPPCQVHDVPRQSSQRRSRKDVDKSSTDSDDECSLATPFAWTIGMVRNLVRNCTSEPD
ncbi:uncharacterized protein LOC144180460 isoform X2 [Haemaphysalis longicornis]